MSTRVHEVRKQNYVFVKTLNALFYSSSKICYDYIVSIIFCKRRSLKLQHYETNYYVVELKNVTHFFLSFNTHYF